MTELELLRAARDYIAQEGHWGQGAYQQGEKVCALGALKVMSAPNNIELPEAYFDAKSALYAANGYDSVVMFNDTPGRTQAEVVKLFNRAIKLAQKARRRWND